MTSQNLILFDDGRRSDFFPLSLTRPVGALRCGILTLIEKWQKITGLSVSFASAESLSESYPATIAPDNLVINSRYIACSALWDLARSISFSESLVTGDDLVAVRLSAEMFPKDWMSAKHKKVPAPEYLLNIRYPEDLIKLNASQLESDYELLTSQRTGVVLSGSNTVFGDRLFAEEGVQCECATINTLTGSVYLGKNAVVMEGCHIRGPFAMLPNSTLKMGSKVYGATTLGPYSTLGGEVKNSIITGFSNKAHEGYLGDSVIGEWCNLGADTNNSNMKNNYGPVSLYSYSKGTMRLTDLQFLGVIMGDHSKTGINVTLNTGTVVGVGVNFYGPGLSPHFIPDFSWGQSNDLKEHRLDKMIETAGRMMIRRNKSVGKADIDLLGDVFKSTAYLRV